MREEQNEPKCGTVRTRFKAFRFAGILAAIAMATYIVLAGAGVLVQVWSGNKSKRMIARARTDEAQLVDAIETYVRVYDHFPVFSNAQAYALNIGNNAISSGSAEMVFANNGIVAILIDATNLPANANHQMNPQQIRFLDIHRVDIGKGGISPDGAFRDPWGNPYVISMDLKNERRCEDNFYRKRAVSQQSGSNGFFGLNNTIDPNGKGDHFALKDQVMVWSLGPGGNADPTIPANQGANAGHVLSWWNQH